MITADFRIALGVFASLGVIGSYVVYCRDVLQGRTKPHAFSWLIWSILGTIGFFGQLSDNAGPGAWSTAFITIGCLITFLLSLRKGERNITKFDILCLIVSLGAIPLWAISHTPLWSMLIISAIDAIGFLPTLRKSWSKPNEETSTVYSVGAINLTLSLFAMENFTLTTAFYPVVLVIMNAISVFVILLRRKELEAHAA
jgi:hypothetical protein